MALKKIGSLWKKQDKSKKEFLSGELDLGVFGKARVAVFESKDKKENQPDAVICLFTPDK